jgi:DNA-directed RNA polymerase subunit RPC12/RpoP
VEKGYNARQKTADGIARQMKKPAVKAALDKLGWIKCPNCKFRLIAKDKARWDGRFHLTCGQKITIQEPSK